mmetsp:Transcript_6915/g.13707  ORF Transcript_6915/g.13707 Transcript_6915/m.13707 type:complete len:80 (+) Transcript_6915:1287-1526(+)
MTEHCPSKELPRSVDHTCAKQIFENNLGPAFHLHHSVQPLVTLVVLMVIATHGIGCLIQYSSSEPETEAVRTGIQEPWK